MNNTLYKATAISDENTPNILSNELDQAPKVWKAYEERLQDPELRQEIYDAMDQYYEFIGKEWDGDEIIKWFEANHNRIPFQKIYKSKENKVSFLVHKHKKTWLWWWTTTWTLLDANEQFSKLWDILGKEWLKSREIWTYITFTKDNSGRLIVGAEQIEIPWEFNIKWVAYHKVLNSEEFKKILDKSTYLQDNN